jgi:hypothetical protein
MPSKVDVPTVLFVLGLVFLTSAILTGEPISQPGIGRVIVLGLVSAIFLYATYWGLVIRRGLAVGIYRSQALGMSLLSLGLLSLLVTNITGSVYLNSPVLASNASFLFRSYALSLLILFWVDSSMRASRDLDPLSRDSLHWGTARYVAWALSLVGIAGTVGFLIVTGNYGFYDNPPPGLGSDAIQLMSLLPYFVTPIAGFVALPIGALRSKDKSFKRQLQWFALALLFLFVFSSIAGLVPNNSLLQNDFYGLTFLFVAYCLYRSVRALVPLNSILPA